MFISETDLVQFKLTSYMYKDLPCAVIFYRELKRKGHFDPGKKLSSDLFYNFFNRFDPKSNRLEVLFSDNSTLLIDFETRKCSVYHPQTHFFEVIKI